LEPKLQCQFDHLRQIHILDKLEDDPDKSRECIKVFKFSEGKAADDSFDHRCLVEWNDLNISQLWVNFFELCLSNPTPISSFAREQSLFEKDPFCHLIPYCKAKPSLNISEAYNVSTSPTTVKY
jgi:hypothetical protein